MKELDELDLKILATIEKEGFVSPDVSKISKELKKPITTIYSRLKRLEAKKILKGFKPLIAIGEKNITAFMLIEAAPGTDPDDLGRKLARIPEVKEVYFTTGEWYFLIKLKVKDMDEYYKISGETLVKEFSQLTKIVGLMAPKTYKE